MKNKKKTKPVSHFKSLIKGIMALSGIAGCGFIALFCYLGFMFGSPVWSAQWEVNALRFTRLPPQSEFISFDVSHGTADITAWYRGVLYFSSELPESILLDFFDQTGFDKCDPGFSVYTPSLALTYNDDGGVPIYKLCRFSQYD